MPKLPWMKFWVTEWMADAALSMCRPETRGVWIDLLCAMHRMGSSGVLHGTVAQLVGLVRGADEAMIEAALADLDACNAADVSRDSHGLVTVTNRRMARAATTRNGNRLRKSRERGHADVTPMSRECHAGEEEKKRRKKHIATALGIPRAPASAGAAAEEVLEPPPPPEPSTEAVSAAGHAVDRTAGGAFGEAVLAKLSAVFPEILKRGVDLAELNREAATHNGHRFAFVAAVVMACRDASARRPLACAKHRVKSGDQVDLALQRRVRSICEPPPVGNVCRCGKSARENYCPGSGRSTYTCECGNKWDR